MVLWINGAFGSGKSSAANEVCRMLPKAYVYDPEQTGYFLWDIFPASMKRKGNFQHIPIWREMNYKILKHIDSHYNGVIVAPQTIYVKQYYDEIIGKLVADKVDVKHFILSASRQTIVSRLASRGEDEKGWAGQHIEQCLTAFDTDITEEKIDTDGKSVTEIAYEMAIRIRESSLGHKCSSMRQIGSAESIYSGSVFC
ncbi:MAG: AAA family ATPase [Oscillospiraceae bacterium]|jgi:cytidylate kinase|nr:AAA family ATPase [Oscillospiraceae bacterium]